MREPVKRLLIGVVAMAAIGASFTDCGTGACR